MLNLLGRARQIKLIDIGIGQIIIGDG